MSSRIDRSPISFARALAGLFVVAAVLAGCVASAGASPTAPDASGSPATDSPAPSGIPGTFYLRAWQYQALPPEYTFNWLPSVTIADGSYVDGKVAVPAIYPGPIYVGLSARPISTAGIDAIVAEARTDGLLGDKTNFSSIVAPGSIQAHVLLVVDGVTHDLTGPLLRDAPSVGGGPGTADAFLDFWNFIGGIDGWIGTELGQSSPYSPTSVAVMLTPPTEAKGAIVPTETPWPLASTFAAFGKPYGGIVNRCATVTGTDLAKLLPVVQSSNALTRFVDSTGAKMSLQARVLVPGEPGPCA